SRASVFRSSGPCLAPPRLLEHILDAASTLFDRPNGPFPPCPEVLPGYPFGLSPPPAPPSKPSPVGAAYPIKRPSAGDDVVQKSRPVSLRWTDFWRASR